MKPVLVGMLVLANGCFGLVMPSTMVMALDGHGKIAGMASSLGGTLQMVCGSIAVTVASPFFDGTVAPMTVAIAICAIGSFVIANLASRPRRASDSTL